MSAVANWKLQDKTLQHAGYGALESPAASKNNMGTYANPLYEEESKRRTEETEAKEKKRKRSEHLFALPFTFILALQNDGKATSIKSLRL